MERGRAEGASWALPYRENQTGAPTYLDPAAFSRSETSPAPRACSDGIPVTGLAYTMGPPPVNLLPSPAAWTSKWWLDTARPPPPVDTPRPCPTGPLSTRCPPAPILPGQGRALCRVAGEPREQGLESICSLSKCVAVYTCVCVSGCGGDRQPPCLPGCKPPEWNLKEVRLLTEICPQGLGSPRVPTSCPNQSWGRGQAICLRQP